MDFKFEGVDYANFSGGEALLSIRGGQITAEGNRNCAIDIELEGIDRDTLGELTQAIYEDYNCAEDFLDLLNSDSKRQIEDYLSSGVSGSFTPEDIVEQFDGRYDEWEKLGGLVRDDSNQEGELKSFLEEVGMEKIKELLKIKMVVYEDQGRSSD